MAKTFYYRGNGKLRAASYFYNEAVYT